MIVSVIERFFYVQILLLYNRHHSFIELHPPISLPSIKIDLSVSSVKIVWLSLMSRLFSRANDSLSACWRDHSFLHQTDKVLLSALHHSCGYTIFPRPQNRSASFFFSADSLMTRGWILMKCHSFSFHFRTMPFSIDIHFML